MDQQTTPRKPSFSWRKLWSVVPKITHRNPASLPEARPGALVVSSTWRALPDEFDPGGQKAEVWQTLHEGCTLESIVTPEAGGYRHVLVMVPTPRVTS